MSPPLETVLMMHHKLSFREARKVVAEGRSNLCQQGTTDWDESLLGECTKLVESQREMNAKTSANETTDSDGQQQQGDTATATGALHSSASVIGSSGDDHPDCASIASASVKSVKSAKSLAQGIKKGMRAAARSLVRPALTERKSYIEHYMGSGNSKDEIVDETDTNSEAAAADIGCNVSITERSITERHDDCYLEGDDDEGYLNVDEMTTRNDAIVKRAIHLTKSDKQIKKADEESTVTTFESSLSDIPTFIYVVHDVSHLTRTKNRSLQNAGKPKNILGRLRKSFVKTKSKRFDMLSEDSPEAYANTFVSI